MTMRNYLAFFLVSTNFLFHSLATNDGCKRNMRLFGPNDQYQCNCRELAFCDFKHNGKCNNGKCTFGYGGPYCQTILHDQRLNDQIPEDKNIFTNRSKNVNNTFQVFFNGTYRINQLRMTCETSAKEFSVFIGGSKFCEMSCLETAHCTGDMTGDYLLIETQSDIQISNMKITGCSPGWFGENCDKQCHCADDSECHKITGNCPNGCEMGRRGSDCQTLNYVNVALNKSAEQSTTKNKDVILVNGTCKEKYFNFSASLAVDGNTDQRHMRLSCMHTESERYPKWSVHLGKTYNIRQIRIYKRDSENSDDLIGFEVFVGNDVCKELSEDIVKPSKIIDVVCNKGLRGNSVSIKDHNYLNLRKRQLHICEVEVLQCLPGFYGNRCNNACQGCRNSSCDPWSGHCLLGCAPGYKPHPTRRKCIGMDDIWDEPHQVSTEITKYCDTNMRMFGTNNQYQCNCKELRFCDFGNNGKCQTEKCIFGYREAFCQKIAYHSYLRNMPQHPKILTNESTEIKNSVNITFTYKYRINSIKIFCQNSKESKLSLYIGSTKFCETECKEKIKCQGDLIGKYLFINATSSVSLSKMRVFGCSPGWFGIKCDKQCHCADDSECHKITGNCPNGCEMGRRGSDCQTLNYENVALHKNASQTTTYTRSTVLINNTCAVMDFEFSASLVVDGNTDQQHERKSCSHTLGGRRYQSLTVDLGRKYNISQIRIYNRNINMKRLIGTYVYVDAKWCNSVYEDIKIIDLKCKNVTNGQKIKFKRYSGVLQMCEVEVLQCLPGFHGNRCNNSCPECKNSSCDQWSGECLSGCALGFSSKPCTVCSFGKFGEGCSKTCHCKNNSNCIKETGVCINGSCAAGYHGSSCQKSCSVGFFGESCSQTCHCKDNDNCNKETGTCGGEGCSAGYKGYNCQETCSFGKFGEGCSKTCHCKEDNHCIKETGVCRKGNCALGYYGSSCQKRCSVGSFGESCSQTCHCKNNTNCNKETGTCGDEGCSAGYKGHNCQETKILIPIIIGISVLLIIFAAVAIYIKCKKFKTKEKKTLKDLPIISLPENIQMDSVVDDDDDDDDDDDEYEEPIDNHESIYMNYESLQEKPVKITKDEILSYVKTKKMEDLPFADEFLKLPKGLLYAHTAATEEKNRTKNRYKTILPYDHSRVRLHPDEYSSSDYINANYLTEDKTYIATQGPLTSTISDFWRMIHQTKCHIIVMLTNLSENGKLKSEQYWPEVKMTRTYGIISVSHRSEKKYSYYTYRTFCLTKNSETFWVKHYQFTSWPDHGVPKDPENFIAFRNKVRSVPNYNPPILVHCSAGVGRTGSYIILDIILEEMENNPKIDIIGLILTLRKDRTLMVQNRCQLEFIYDVLVENITTGSTMVYVSDLPQVYNQLLKFQEKNSSSYLKQQFEKFLLPFNKVSSAAYDNAQYIPDDENDVTPIDTTILSGNNLEEEFILISTPSEEIFADFWNSVFLKRTTILIMFDDLLNEAAAYWPVKDSTAEYKHIIVKLVEEEDNNYYIKRTMKVSSTKLNIPELLVHQIQFKIWLNSEFPSPEEMVDIIKAVRTLQLSQSKQKMTLHCQDGISKNGLFCVMYMIIELLDTDTVISLVQLIKLLKKRKKEIIPDYMSYHYCWLVAKVYLQEHSLYSNVSNMIPSESDDVKKSLP